MATFLELCRETRSLSGVGGTGPTDVNSATGIEGRIVNYVKNAYTDIQAHPKKWKWMWGHYLVDGQPLQTVQNTREYVLDGVKHVRVKSFKSYLTSLGTDDRQRMRWLAWQDFEAASGVVNEEADRPIRVSRQPSGNLVLYPKPDDVYSIEFEYFKTAQVLQNNDDVPEMPVDYHQLIVYEALKRFGHAEDAQEILRFGEAEAGSEGGEGRPVNGLWRALIWQEEFKDADTEDEDVHMVVRPRGRENY